MLNYPVIWSRRGLGALLLLPLSLLFGIVVSLRRWLYRHGWLRSERLPVPVIVIGNISVGGAGKTPLTLWLAQTLRDAGFTPGIVSRGYGGSYSGSNSGIRAVAPNDDPKVCGDEPVLLARASGCPVWIGRERAAAGRALIAAHPACDVVLCDDGLQHYRLQRDIEIAVVDGQRGLGNGFLLPAGPLRESAVRLGAVAAVVVRGDTKHTLPVAYHTMHLNPAALVNARHRERHEDATYFKSKTVHAIAGIGNPQQFFDTLTRMGIAHIAHAFPDHHAYVASDLHFDGCDAVVMTEKDAVKCEAYAEATHWVLTVQTEVDSALAQQVITRLNKIKAQ